MRNSTTRENLASDCSWGTTVTAGNCRISPQHINASTYNWTWTTPFNLRPGTYTFSVQATDNLGLTTSSSLRASLTINVQVPGDAFPDTTINPTGTVNGVQVLHLDLAGTASDDIGVSSVGLTIVDQDTSLLPAAERQPGRGLRAAQRRRSRTRAPSTRRGRCR